MLAAIFCVFCWQPTKGNQPTALPPVVLQVWVGVVRQGSSAAAGGSLDAMTATQRRALAVARAAGRRGSGGRDGTLAAREFPAPHLRNLVLVACHSVYTGLDFTTSDDKSSWYLLDYQKVGAAYGRFIWLAACSWLAAGSQQAPALGRTQQQRQQLNMQHTHVCVVAALTRAGFVLKQSPPTYLLQDVPGQTNSFVEHIQLGVKEAAADPDALLLFSGGKTRRCVLHVCVAVPAVPMPAMKLAGRQPRHSALC